MNIMKNTHQNPTKNVQKADFQLKLNSRDSHKGKHSKSSVMPKEAKKQENNATNYIS